MDKSSSLPVISPETQKEVSMEKRHESFYPAALLAVAFLFCRLPATAEVIKHSETDGNEAVQKVVPRDNSLDKARIERLREMAKRKFPDDVTARSNYVHDWVVKDVVYDKRELDKVTFIDTDNGKLPNKEEIMNFSGSADALRSTTAVVVDLPPMKEIEQNKVLLEGFKEALKLYELKRQLKKQPNSIWNDLDGWKPEQEMSFYAVRKPYDVFKVNLGALLHGRSISDFPIKDLKLRNLNRSFYSQRTLKDKMVQMAIHDLQNDEEFLKQAIDVRARAENLLDNEKFTHPKKEDDILFPELKDFYKDNAAQGGDGKPEDKVLQVIEKNYPKSREIALKNKEEHQAGGK